MVFQLKTHIFELINEIAVAETDKAYSNTKDGASCKNSNIIDL